MIYYKIFADYKLILLVFEGNARFDEYKNVIESLRKDPDFSIDYNVLTDMRKALTLFPAEDVKSLAKYASTFIPRPQKKLNAIIARNDLHFALSRMYEMLSECQNPFDTKVFRSLEESLQWLKNDIPIGLLRDKETESNFS